MRPVKLFEQFVNETINASDAYEAMASVQTVIDGKRELAYLATMDQSPYGPYDEKVLIALDHAKENGLKVLKVKNRKPGRAWVIYKKDKKKAQELANIASEHGGFLSDDSPWEAGKIGRLLDYSEKDIKAYIKRKYGY